MVYGFDLTGAGAGVGAGAGRDVRGARVLPGAAAAAAAGRRALFIPGRPAPGRPSPPAVPRCSAAEALLLLDNQAAFNEFKAIYAPLHTPRRASRGTRAVAARRLPAARTISPSASTPTSPTTPACCTCPARRAASACIATATASPPCPARARWMSAMRRAALDAAPYLLRPHASVLLAGAVGGFRIAEVLALGAAQGAGAGARAGAVPRPAPRAGPVSGLAGGRARDAVERRPDRRRRQPARATTSSTCRPTSWTRPRRT